MSAAIENATLAAIASRFTKTDFVRKKERRERVARFIFGSMALLMIVPLALIVGYLFIRALPVLSFDFLFKVPVRGMRAGGIWPALLGTIYLVLISLAVATPIGVLAAVYLNEYARDNDSDRHPQHGAGASRQRRMRFHAARRIDRTPSH